MEKIAIGRIVHYLTSHGERPAIITYVFNDTVVNLSVFTDGSSDADIEPVQRYTSVSYGDSLGRWHFYQDEH